MAEEAMGTVLGAASVVKDSPVALAAVALVAFVLGAATGAAIANARNLSQEKLQVPAEEEELDEDDVDTEFDENELDDDELEGEECKMVLVVNQELGMSKGKIAAQCCHACLAAFKRAPKKFVRPWAMHGQAKVALKCPNLNEMLEIAENARAAGLPYYVVADAGRTQIAAGSRTVCAIGPGPVSVIDAVTGHLKLL